DVLKRLLEEEGREIALAGSPDEAMQIAARGPLDVALVDKNLQGASGLDLSRKLKGLQPELEVILITGYASLDTAIEAVQNGAAVQLYEYTLEELTRLRATQLGPTELGRHEHRRKDGACFTADVSATEFTLKGRRLRVQSVRDATAAVQAERERRALEERLR